MATVNDPGSIWHGAEILYTYTRAQAIDDGSLTLIALHPFKLPLAVTLSALAWARRQGWDDGPDDSGAMRQLIGAAFLRVREECQKPDSERTSRVSFQFAGETWLLDCGPGDNAEPVLTLGLPEDF